MQACMHGAYVFFPAVVWVGQGEMFPVDRGGNLYGDSVSPRLPHCWAVNQPVSLPTQQRSPLLPTHSITPAATVHHRGDSRRLDVCAR